MAKDISLSAGVGVYVDVFVLCGRMHWCRRMKRNVTCKRKGRGGVGVRGNVDGVRVGRRQSLGVSYWNQELHS